MSCLEVWNGSSRGWRSLQSGAANVLLLSRNAERFAALIFVWRDAANHRLPINQFSVHLCAIIIQWCDTSCWWERGWHSIYSTRTRLVLPVKSDRIWVFCANLISLPFLLSCGAFLIEMAVNRRYQGVQWSGVLPSSWPKPISIQTRPSALKCPPWPKQKSISVKSKVKNTTNAAKKKPVECLVCTG